MRRGVIRPLIDGGCSECYASDENVGKRRCRHVLTTSSPIIVEKSEKMNWINLDGKENSFSTNEKDIKDYMSNISTTLSKKDQETILSELRHE